VNIDYIQFGSTRRIVLADANVLFSRSLRDYLLVAGEEDLISVVWSNEILDEMARNLVKSLCSKVNP